MTADQVADRMLAAACDHVIRPQTVVVQGDFRPRVLLPGRGGRLLDDFAADLAKELHDKPIFNRGGLVLILDDRRTRLQPITASTFRSWIEKHDCGGVVCQGWVGRDEHAHIEDQTLSKEGAEGVLSSPRFQNGLRSIARVNLVRQPVIRKTKDGQKHIELLEPGYDEETQIFTIDTVDYDEEMPIEKATDVFKKWFADTAFDPKDPFRSESVATAMLLAAYCDCMFSRFTVRPAFIIAGNTEGAGKTSLAMLAIAPVFGPTKLTPPPTGKESDKLTELLNSVAQAGSQYVVFDNWRGKIEHPALEAFITANTWGSRVLGTSYLFEADKNCIVYVTANKATVGGDMRRRSLFVDLWVGEARAEDRLIKQPINEGDILDDRANLLAAYWAYVRNWRDAGCPRGSLRHGSFDEWGRALGGILEALSYPSPLLPPPSRVDPKFDHFTRIVAAVAAEMKGDEEFVPPGELLEVARKVGAFPWFMQDTDNVDTLTDKERRSERRYFATQCDDFKGRTFQISVDGDTTLTVTFDSIGEGHSKQYRFNRRLHTT